MKYWTCYAVLDTVAQFNCRYIRDNAGYIFRPLDRNASSIPVMIAIRRAKQVKETKYTLDSGKLSFELTIIWLFSKSCLPGISTL